jgi:hypothetical protein
MAAAAGGGPGVLPAAVHVQVRRLQPVLPGARGRAAGRAGDHGVLPGGVAVQVRQPALHAVRPVPPSEGGGSGRADGGLAGRCGDSPEAQQRRSGAVEPTLACAMLRAGCRVVLGLARRARARVWAGMRDLQGARGGDLPPHTHTYSGAAAARVFFPSVGRGRAARAGIGTGPTTRCGGMAGVRRVSVCWIEEEGCDESCCWPAAHPPARVRTIQVLILHVFNFLRCFRIRKLATKFCGNCWS